MKLNQIASNFTSVEIGGYTFYFSYETCIGIKGLSDTFVSENVWSNTTGKHLNQLEPDKKKRLPNEQFKKLVVRLEERALLNAIPYEENNNVH